MSTQVALKDLRQDINSMESQFKLALPAHIPSSKFVRTVLTALQNNPDLIQAERQSVLSGCMKAAQDGLLIDNRDAALVIFNTKDGDKWVKKAQYMPMISGILKKARNSGSISTLSAHIAYEKDKFVYLLGDEEKIIHEPFVGGNRGKPIAAYAIVKLKDGSIQREVMTVDEIEAVRKRSRTSDKGPWVSDWSEMARKTVLRRIAKYIPSSADKEGESLVDITSRDDDLYDMDSGEVIEVQTEKPQRKTKAAAAILENTAVSIEPLPDATQAID